MRSRWVGSRLGARTGAWVVGGVLAVVVACGKSPTGGGPPGKGQPDGPRITSASLVAGGEGVLTGTGLEGLSGTLTVDGVVVAVTSRTASEIRFRMPVPRACEVDARAVSIASEAVTYLGRLTVPGVARMEVGESRILAAGELASLCLKLPAGSEEYVLSAVNRSLDDRSTAADPMFTLRVHTAGGRTGRQCARGRQCRCGPPGGGAAAGRAVSRTQDASIAVAAGRGNYVAWYLPARFADAGRGASLTFEDVRPGPFLIRLTRLR